MCHVKAPNEAIDENSIYSMPYPYKHWAYDTMPFSFQFYYRTYVSNVLHTPTPNIHTPNGMRKKSFEWLYLICDFCKAPDIGSPKLE